MNWTVLHLHSEDSNPCSGVAIDSITSFQAYVDKAKEYGMKALAFTEHGVVLRNVAKKVACEKAGLKYIHGEEFYVTEKIDSEHLVRDNYHCCLYARNYEGVKELNKLSSIAFNREDGHFYHNPRITLEELENTSDNILISTACVAGILCKGTPTAQESFLNFIISHKDRCWLEIQPHTFDLQVKYNQYLYQISMKYGLNLIATNDVHAIDSDHMDGRLMMQKAKMKKGDQPAFKEENECDLTFKSYDEIVQAFSEQGAIPQSVYLKAIEETNRFADLIEPYELDYSNKYPRLYGNDSEQEFICRIREGIKNRGIDKLPNYQSEYIPRIKEEFETYKHNDAIDFMLLDSDYKNWMLENDMHYGPSRGSVSGSLIAYLINVTDVDSVKYNLNFSRFMNPERVSLADVDTDIYEEDRYKVREYFFNKDRLQCCNIVTFNRIKARGAIEDIGRAFGLSPAERQEMSNQVTTVDGQDIIPQSLKDENPEMFRYVDMVINVLTSLGRHAAGIVCSPTDVESDFGTLTISSDPRPVSQIDMHDIDSLNYVKIDLLGLNAVGLLDKTCKLAGIDYRSLSSLDFSDEEVIKSMANDTTLIFQFESGFASDLLKQTLSGKSLENIRKQNEKISYLDIMAMVNGAIRPAGESYRDDLVHGIYKDNGNKALNDFLKPTLGYLVFQESLIDFLHTFCGYTMGQADIVRRHFAKKTGTESDIPIIENGGYMTDIHGNQDDRYIKGFVAIAQEEYGMTEDEARRAIQSFLQVIKDASSYLFSRNHSIPYSMIGYYIAWLRYYYPIELFTAALDVYQDNRDKTAKIAAYIKSKGIRIEGIKFGKSKSNFFMDKESNTIYQGIGSIKECNDKIGEELYELSQQKVYTSFIDLLIDVKNLTSINSTKLDILIKLGYFSDFGDVNKLLKTCELFDKYYGRKQIGKDKVLEEGIDFDVMRRFASETPKMFTKINSRGLLNYLVDEIDVPPITLKQAAQYQLEYLGHIDIVDKQKYSGVCMVTDININYSPKLTLYAFANGNTIPVKINKKIFANNVLRRGDLIHVNDQRRQNQLRYSNGQYEKTDVMEWWLLDYEVLNDNDYIVA